MAVRVNKDAIYEKIGQPSFSENIALKKKAGIKFHAAVRDFCMCRLFKEGAIIRSGKTNVTA